MKKQIGRTLVAGAGAAGIRSALDLAQIGYQVLLIDKSDHTGGLLNQLDTQFPSKGCGFCRGLPLFDRDRSSQHCLKRGFFHDNVEVLLSTRIIAIDGEPGDFTVTLKQSASQIDPGRCTGCGKCAEVCPVETDDPYNAGMIKHKAVYLPTPHSFSNAWTIDVKACTRCGACEPVCPANAIHITEQEREKFKILVVDDEKIIRDSMEEWLKEEGFRVAAADSGQKALDMMEAAGGQEFNMMLTDIKMPGMDGVELLTAARQINPDLAVIMMTAYADVDSAVDAMKQGALDYLTKPFDPDLLISMTLDVFEEYELAQGRKEKVDAVVLSEGSDLFDPGLRKNPYGYGRLPGVITGLEMERLLSGSGPENGQALNPATGKTVKRVGWIQCAGSRDIQEKAAFCSSACCMISVKQAVLLRKKMAVKGLDIETVIFYIDMRTMGKPFEACRQEAENCGVRFVRARVHTLEQRKGPDGPVLSARYTGLSGNTVEDEFDMMVLATGARPGKQMQKTARENEIDLNEWGFINPLPFSMTRTSRQGIFAAGAVTGFKDISDTIISASAAAMEAVSVMQQAERKTLGDPEDKPSGDITALSREAPRISIVLCGPGDVGIKDTDIDHIKAEINNIPEVISLNRIDPFDTRTGSPAMDDLTAIMEKYKGNRLIIGVGSAHITRSQILAAAKVSGLPAHLLEILVMNPHTAGKTRGKELARQLRLLVSKARFKNPLPVEQIRLARIETTKNVLVIGGGTAGMTAALFLADAGCHVDLVEKTSDLGGNLLWMERTIGRDNIQAYLAAQIKQVESHSRIDIHKKSCIEGVISHPGGFTSFLTKEATDQPNEETAIYHGAVILATGGSQVPLPPGQKEEQSVNDNTQFTQKAFQKALAEKRIDPSRLETVVMIQCSGTRNETGGNYCSRICCIHTLKTALELLDKNPGIQVMVLYRDLMSYGFYETWYHKAREKGVLFFQYHPDHPPRVSAMENGVRVSVRDHVLDRPVDIEADAVIHATGIEADLPQRLAQSYGEQLDEFQFFKEADYKFRPVDGSSYRVFSCGLSLRPCTIDEAAATAEAAAVRALAVLRYDSPMSGKTVAHTRQATCTLCEMCIDACPYHARSIDLVEDKIIINPAACQGCGICASVCPSDSAILEGFSPAQMLDMIDMSLT